MKQKSYRITYAMAVLVLVFTLSAILSVSGTPEKYITTLLALATSVLFSFAFYYGV